MPAKDPVKLHVWFTENNFDKYVSFSRSLGKWTHTTLVFNDLVSVKLKFVTAQLRSDNVVFTGTPVPSLAEDRSSSKSKKILFESVSVNKHFFVDQPEKDHYFYLPLDNFKLSNVSYGKHCFFKNADPQTDAANTKKVLGVYLTVENNKTNFYGKVSRLTVLFEDLMANVHSHAWVRDPTNKWSRVSLTDKEVSALKDLLKETKSNLSKRGKLDTTVKFFSNFLSQTEKEQGARTGLKLSGRVLVPDTSPVFFNYDLLTDEMDIYVSSHKTLFYSSVKDDTFNSFKLLVVKEGYEATVLKTSDRVLYSASTDEKRRNKVYGDRIVAVYMTPATKPDSLCLYLSDRLGVKKLVSFRKQLDQSKGSDEWFESPLSSSYANLLKFKFDQAVSHSTSLRLECYDYTTGFFFGDNMIPNKQLTRSEYFVSTDSEVRNTPFRGFYSIFNESDDSTILIPLNNNKLSHIKCGTETLFSLSSQFHTVRALMITPKLNPDTVIVYYNDDENNDYYTSFTKLVPRTPAAPPNPTSSVESTAQKLFVNPNKLWQERQLMFFSSLGTIKKIHSTLETFATNNPALVSSTPTGMNDSSKYNLTLTLTGVYTPEDGPAKEFVFFYDPNHKGSAYVFDDERVVEHKNVFDLVFKNSQYMSYLYVKSNPSYAVKSLMMDSQVLMDFEGSSEFDSLTLTSPLNPSVLLLTTMDSSSSMHYYFAKKDDKWQTMGLDMAKYLKMKVMLHNASEEMKLLDSYVKPESDVKRSSPVTMRKFDFNLSTHESFSEEYTLKKGSLSGYEFMVGRTRQNTNVGKILDSNLLVWNNFDNARVVRFGFSPPKDPSLLCVGYILDDKEVFDFFHKTGGEWHEYYTMKNVPSLLTHISGLNLSSFVLDLSAVDKDSEHFKLRTHYYNGVSIVSGFVSPHSTLTSVVDNGQDVLSKSKLVGIKVHTFVYSQSENPTYFGFYFTDKNKKQYELYHKQEHTWVPYFGMNEDGRLLLKELLHEKDTFDQLNPENQLFNPDNEFYYNISDSNNLSNKHYDVERQTTKPFDYVLVTVHKNQRLMKVLDNNLTVWTPKETVTQVLSFMYYPPDNPIYFSIASRTSSAREVQFEYYYKSENKWTPYTDPMNIPQILKLPLYSATESPSTTSPPKLVFDLSLDFSADFYKCLYDYNLTLYKDLLFETFVPKSGVEVTKVTDSFNVIYHKLSEEKITRISFYPNNEPKLLLVDVKNSHSHGTQKPLTRKFVLNNSWVVNDEEFDKRVLSYSKSEQKAVSVDLSQLTKGNTTFEDFLVVRESLNSAFETLVVTPILGKKIVSIFDGPQPVWLSREEARLDSCYFFPVDAPELLSVLSTDLDIRYYSKLNDKWSEVSSVAFEYLSSFYSGTSNTIELTHLSKFEPVLPLEDSYINLYDGFKLPSKEIKTRYDFLKTGLIKYDSILFGMASIKSDESESDKSPSSTTPHVLAITYSGEPLFKLNNDQKFLDLIFYPLDKPSMFTVTFLQGDDTLHKFFLRSASEKHECLLLIFVPERVGMGLL
ncbi:hypothetical protein TpMuguga_02g00761 [Theileria parva strain Muguga]|uniref:Uncharacterized protein n=1 Tax=Theileria parva TaxID=5875 RepID=Q4N478_THEPA|nr:uncharacterized protein TpMuguga_02g00761 [Theileria parva strain Muguga]EAN33045.1 hypothetical protein TpMuguga_02g00761 [Theileria parva strain Muguga]|eukprot:XP_765328.1 hypothetical protein [Theileria parva strain Muguga]